MLAIIQEEVLKETAKEDSEVNALVQAADRAVGIFKATGSKFRALREAMDTLSKSMEALKKRGTT